MTVLRAKSSRAFARVHDAWARWVQDYQDFARMRGFETFNDWPYHRRGFLECWVAPGFHRFWQLWNPGIAYFVYRLYLRLGGARRWALPTLGAFAGCGAAHALAAAPFAGRISVAPVVTFSCFGLIVIVSRRFAWMLHQERWPAVFNLAVNVALILGAFDLGFRVDRLL